MDTVDIRHKAAAHPILIIAAIAVILFSGVGIAAILGWLPASNANGAGAALTPTASVAAPAAAIPNGANGSIGSIAPPPYAAPDQSNGPAPTVRAPEPAQPAAASCQSCGVVEAVREVHHRGSGSGAGAAGGAILGGLLGNQIGNGHGRQLATVAGAVGGAVAGNQIEGNMRTTTSYDVVVRMNSGATRTFHQGSAPGWREGDHVRVVNGHLRAD